MSVNTAHANNGVLIHSGEAIILFSDNVTMEFSGQDGNLFKGTKTGKIYLTTHRMIFNNRKSSDPLLSMSLPFVCLTDVEVEQPVFGANFIRGKVRAQADGQFNGEVKFKMLFKSGGAIDFAQSALKAAYLAKKYGNNAAPPPYTPPTGAWHQAPPPAYSANPNGYYGWMPNYQAFPQGPPPNSVFMHDSPPPYPGIIPPGPTPNGMAGGPPNYQSYGYGQPAFGQQPPAYPGVATGPQAGYPAEPGYPGGQPGYPGGQPGYPGAQPGSPEGQPGYPGAQPGYPGAQPGYPGAQIGFPGAQTGYPSAYPGGQPGYPGAQAGYPGAQPGYPSGQPGYPGGYPQRDSAGFQRSATDGFSGTVVDNGPGFPNHTPSAPIYSKEEEANQSANYNARTSSSQANSGGFAPPPDMNELPPSYNSLANKKQN